MRIEGEGDEKIFYHSGPEILNLLDLRESELDGKTMLDIGSGPRTLENYLRDSGSSTAVVSMDVRHEQLVNPDAPNMAVQAAFDHQSGEFLPFQNESFDLVVDVFGSQIGGTHPEVGMYYYKEALRVTKSGGEVRIVAPFNRKLGPVTWLLYSIMEHDWYSMFGGPLPKMMGMLEGAKQSDKIEIKDPARDDRVLWRIWKMAGREEQEKFSEIFASHTEDVLNEKGENVDIEMVDVSDKDPRQLEEDDKAYLPCMIIKKLAASERLGSDNV